VEEIETLVMRAASRAVKPAERLAAFGELVKRFQDMAYGYAYSILGDFHLAEDAAQEAFIAAYRQLPSLRQPAAFAGWLRRIVHTQCNRLTRRKRPATSSLDAATGVPAGDAAPDEAAEAAEVRRHVLHAVRSLPNEQRAVTTLFYIDGYSQRDIAEFLEVPVTTVNNRLHASRTRLRERMLQMVKETLPHSAPDERFGAKIIQELLDRPRPLEIEGHPIRQVAETILAALDGYQPIEGEEIVDKAAFVGVSADLAGAYQVDEARALRVETSITTFEAIVGRTAPVRLVTAGRVFRRDEEDALHSKVFHQIDAICVEPGAGAEEMRATLRRAIESVLPQAELRWDEEAHFDFVENALELAVRAGEKWLNIAGCGTLKAGTLRQAGFDPQAVGGFAFGLGLERLAMLAYGIDDIHKLWQPPYVPE
jgi:RNA polymerase sigma factor (sigma-70 family)